MASSGKRKTTMAKLNREAKLRDRRVEKAARKDARKRAAAMPGEPGDAGDEFTDDYADDAEESPVEGLVR
ncbi:MAG: hypothetical protein QOJ12_790 [Thermoleophilales bacterium]|jgi:hypothetical protein|nr:hypothetical protein [Thermoleophilales bacterium]